MPLKSMLFVHMLICLFCASLVTAVMLAHGQTHVLLGLITAVCLILSHVIASFYVIETSIQIKRAVKQKGLDPAFNERHKPHKNKVFPPAFIAMVTMIAAAVTGGAADSGVFPPWLHGALVYLAMAASLIAWPVEGWAVRGTRRLLRELNERLAAAEAAAPQPAEEPEEVGGTPEEGLWLLGRWMLFLGISLWGIYGYMVLVIQAPTSIWPYLVLSVPLTFFGWLLQRRYAYASGEEDASSTVTPSGSS